MDDWIRCEDMLPENPRIEGGVYTRVIVWCPEYGGDMFYKGWYCSRLGEWRIDGSPNAWPVTHWMIPGPPKEANDG